MSRTSSCGVYRPDTVEAVCTAPRRWVARPSEGAAWLVHVAEELAPAAEATLATSARGCAARRVPPGLDVHRE